MIRILLADDHDIVRQGLLSLLNSQADMYVVGETRYGQQVMGLAQKLDPDVVVLDLSMPDLPGLELIRQVRETLPLMKIIVYSMHSESPRIVRSLLTGASGYVTKDVPPTELVRAIRSAIAGQYSISGANIDQETIVEELRRDAADSGSDHLTPRQREVTIHWALGHSTIDTAQAMRVQPRTVEKHRENIRKRLGVRTRSTVLQYALKQGLVVISPEDGLPRLN